MQLIIKRLLKLSCISHRNFKRNAHYFLASVRIANQSTKSFAILDHLEFEVCDSFESSGGGFEGRPV